MTNAIITIFKNVLIRHVLLIVLLFCSMYVMLHNLCTYELPHLPFWGYWVGMVYGAIAIVEFSFLFNFSSHHLVIYDENIAISLAFTIPATVTQIAISR